MEEKNNKPNILRKILIAILIIEQNRNSNIILHGSSMGAATVLMASGDTLPNNIKAIIEDCGYTSVWNIFYCLFMEIMMILFLSICVNNYMNQLIAKKINL